MDENLSQQLIKDLVSESLEGLDTFENELLCLEGGDAGPETINSIFRIIHTIKGSAGCLGLNHIEKISHAGENLLDELARDQIDASSEIVTCMLGLSDRLRDYFADLEAQGVEGDRDDSDVLNNIQQAFLNAKNTAGAAAPAPAASEPTSNESDSTPSSILPETAPEDTTVFGFFDDEPNEEAEAKASPCLGNANSASSVNGKPKPYGFYADEIASEKAAKQAASSQEKKSTRTLTTNAIRVNVTQLDKLMDLVGELVLARNQIIQCTTLQQDDKEAILTASQRLNIITSELQENVMKTRMQPIESIWSQYPRVVRDVAGEVGKKVRLEMEGQSTELDRTILEGIKDPLVHIIRNSIDHGIEKPEVRREQHKSEEGLLRLRAYHEGGQVNIEISDDGGGIDYRKVKERALERGLINHEEASQLTEHELLHLLFQPGFSTAETVSNISGRGVGMDVVRTNIEKIGGTVDLLSEPGIGTTTKIKIPLTLAIIPALIITSAGERFAIPQVSLLELVRLEGEKAKTSIEYLYGAPVYRLRGQLLPLAYLNKELRLEEKARQHQESLKQNARSDAISIIVLQADGRQFGIVVDEINDTEEIVVKPLGKQLKSIKAFAGATIMGDGQVALIIDVLGLAHHAGVISDGRDRKQTLNSNDTEESEGETMSLLLFKVGETSTMAMPLSMVARLEEIPRHRVEKTRNELCVQYREQILPLIDLCSQIGGQPASTGDQDDEPLQVIVYTENGKSAGLIVSAIQDIVQENISVKREKRGNGTLGSIVVLGKVTELLDVREVIARADPCFYDKTA